jgi:outer membrane lipoprotein-sorting protein
MEITRIKKLAATTMVGVLAVTALAGCGGESTQATPTAIAPTATTAAEPTDTVGITDPAETAEPTETVAMMETMEPAETAVTSATREPTTGTSGTLTGPAADLLRESEQAMKDVKSYHASMIIEAAGASFNAEADFVLPDRSRMMMDMGALGNSETIVIGSESYTKLPGTDSYTQVTTGQQNTNVASFLPFAEDATIVGDETIDGVDTTHVTFTYDADAALRKMMEDQGQTPTTDVTLGKATADIWIDKATKQIRRYKYADQNGTTTMTFSKFNEPVNPPIEKPTNITTLPNPDTILTPATP